LCSPFFQYRHSPCPRRSTIFLFSIDFGAGQTGLLSTGRDGCFCPPLFSRPDFPSSNFAFHSGSAMCQNSAPVSLTLFTPPRATLRRCSTLVCPTPYSFPATSITGLFSSPPPPRGSLVYFPVLLQLGARRTVLSSVPFPAPPKRRTSFFSFFFSS